jgi:hypothetical protein
MRTKLSKSHLYVTVLALMLSGVAQAQLGNKLKGLKNKVPTTKSKSSSSKDRENKVATTPVKKESSVDRAKREEAESNAAAGSIQPMADYYYSRDKMMGEAPLNNLGYIDWDDKALATVVAFDHAALQAKMEEDKKKHPELFKIYPKYIPTSGYNAMTRSTIPKDAELAGETEAYPFSDASSKKVNAFYKEYVWWKSEQKKKEKALAGMLRNMIAKTDETHSTKKIQHAQLTWESAKMARGLQPNNMMLEELESEAKSNYNTAVNSLGKLITGNVHRDNLRKIVVFSKEPTIGSEDLGSRIQTITPGQPAYVTGYFTASIKDGGGVPTLCWTVKDEEYYSRQTKGFEEQTKNNWQPMYVSSEVKEQIYEHGYMVFNLFPDVEKVNYKSHLQYLPHLHLVKWLTYQAPEVIELRLRWGLNNEMAWGTVKIDLTGDNRQKLKAYYERLWQKKLEAVRFPEASGCNEMSSKVPNASDLDKYGKRLKLTLSKTGDIMKPWPNDDQVEWNTAAGYGAFERTDGKIEIVPVVFRKAPTETNWQWWSIGKKPRDYALGSNEVGVNAKLLDYGYEILKANATTCGMW